MFKKQKVTLHMYIVDTCKGTNFKDAEVNSFSPSLSTTLQRKHDPEYHYTREHEQCTLENQTLPGDTIPCQIKEMSNYGVFLYGL